MSPSAKLVGIIGEYEENIRKLKKLMKHKLFVTKISAPAAWNGYPKQMNDWLLQTYQKDKNEE